MFGFLVPTNDNFKMKVTFGIKSVHNYWKRNRLKFENVAGILTLKIEKMYWSSEIYANIDKSNVENMIQKLLH